MRIDPTRSWWGVERRAGDPQAPGNGKSASEAPRPEGTRGAEGVAGNPDGAGTQSIPELLSELVDRPEDGALRPGQAADAVGGRGVGILQRDGIAITVGVGLGLAAILGAAPAATGAWALLRGLPGS